jgi:hypothetical protein
MGWMRPLAGLLACGALACGSGPSATVPTPVVPPDPIDAVEDDFPADASAARYHPMHRAAFGPLYGSGCPTHGSCGCGDAKGLADEFNCQIAGLTANDIPITTYLFDGDAWSRAKSSPLNTCTGADCCSWGLGDAVIRQLARDGVRSLLHFWGGCHEEDQYRRAADRLGPNLLGFYLDDGSSDADLQGVAEFMQSMEPGDWEVVGKAFQNREPSTSNTGLSRWTNAAYVGDLSVGFEGLQEAIRRIQQKTSYIPAPFAELTGYGYLDPGTPEEDVYYRRLHFGALQPVMAHTPYANSDPWRPEYGPGLLRAYRYWAWLHKELVPYFYSYAYRMFETPNRPAMWRGPDEFSLRVGRELYVPFVTQAADVMDVRLPTGAWIDYWDESRVVSGLLAQYPVPLGREPIFVRQGALVPLDVERDYAGHGTRESKGSLTVLVYPSGTSSFRYRESARTSWITFTSTLADGQLTLAADPGLPSSPVLYRIARWSVAPESVSADGGRVTVNQGGGLPRLSSERAVNGSRESAWFYDEAARRLIVKVVP